MAGRPGPSRRLTEDQRRLVEDNVALAISVVTNTHAGRRMSHDDRVSVAFVGLCRAALLYDPSRGWKFSTYAANAIRYTLLREEHFDRLIHLPAALAGKAALRRPHLAAEADRVRGVSSLSADEIDPPARADGAEEAEARAADREALWAAIRDLPPRYRWVVAERARGKTLESIGRHMGVSKERARQIEQKGIELIRARLRGESADSWSDSLRARP